MLLLSNICLSTIKARPSRNLLPCYQITVACDGAEVEAQGLGPGAAETERRAAKGPFANLNIKEITHQKEVSHNISCLPSLSLKKGNGEHRGFTD